MLGFCNARLLLFAAIAGLLLIARQSSAAVIPISPLVEDPVTGFQYELLSQADWSDSENAAHALGGDLATISDQEEQNFVFNFFGGYGGVQRILWIGLWDPSGDNTGKPHASNFVWASGAPVTYTNWNPGEPNDSGNAEFYTAMYYPNFNNPGSWNDWGVRDTDPIGIPFFGVAEFMPEPGAPAFCVVAAAAFLLFKRRSRTCRRLPSLV